MPATEQRKYAPRLPAPERREQLLDAALSLIVENGYGAATMEAIARAAGVAKPVVYDAFESRGRLLQALLEREEGRAFAQLARAFPELPADGDPDAGVIAMVDSFLRAVMDAPERWRLIVLPVEGTPDIVRDHVEQGRRAIHGQVREVLAWAVRLRGGPGDVETDLSAHAILALGEHFARLVLTEPEAFPPERIHDWAVGLTAALRPKATGSARKAPGKP